jgi:hypothetical protein
MATNSSSAPLGGINYFGSSQAARTWQRIASLGPRGASNARSTQCLFDRRPPYTWGGRWSDSGNRTLEAYGNRKLPQDPYPGTHP